MVRFPSSPSTSISHGLIEKKSNQTHKKSSTSEEQKLWLLLEQSKKIYPFNPKQAFEIAQVCLQLSKELKTTIGASKSLQIIGGFHFHRGQYEKALEHHSKALQQIEKSIDKSLDLEYQQGLLLEKANLSNNIGLDYCHNNQFPEALDFFFNAIELYDSLENEAGLLGVQINLGIFYTKLGYNEKALDCYSRGLKKIELYLNDPKGGVSNTSDPNLLITIYSNISAAHFASGHYREAIQYGQLALKKAQEINNKRFISKVQNNLAHYHLNFDNIDKSLQYNLKALELKKEIKDKRGMGRSYLSLGQVYSKKNEYSTAIDYLNKAIAIAQNYNDQEAVDQEAIIDAWISIGSIYSEQNYLERALDYFLKAFRQISQTENPLALGTVLTNIAECYFELSKINHSFDIGLETYKSIEDILVRALQLANATDHLGNLLDVYKVLIQYHEYHKEFEKAFHFQSLYLEKREQFISQNYSHEMNQLKIKNDLFQKEQVFKQRSVENKISKQKEQLENKEVQLKSKTKNQYQLLHNQQTQAQQFVHLIHHLRKPIQTLNTCSNLLSNDLKPQLNHLEKKCLNHLVESSKNLNQTLSGLLLYSTLDPPMDRRKEINTSKLLKEVTILLKEEIENSGTEIEIQDLPDIFASESHMIQLFYHLIENAIKFRNPSKINRIKIGFKERPGGSFFFIQDNGIGIKEAQKREVFHLCKQVNPQKSGNGMGLAICEKIVKIYNGVIWIESEFNEGSTVYFNYELRITNGGF